MKHGRPEWDRARSELDKEFQRRGLIRAYTAMKILKVDQQALNWLVEVGDLTVERFRWKNNHTYRGFDQAQLEDGILTYRDGRVRLSHAAQTKQ